MAASSFVGIVLLSLAPAVIWWSVFSYLIPDEITVPIPHHAVQLHNLHQKAYSGRYLGPLTMLGIFAAELISLGWLDSSLRRVFKSPNGSTRSDITVFLSSHLQIFAWLQKITTVGIALLSGEWLRAQIVAATGLTAGLAMLPLPLEVAALYLIYTFLDYWAHRLAHTHYFWPLHRFHHAAEDFCILTALRTHPSDLTDLFVVTLPLALMGPSVGGLATMAFIISYVRLLIHSRVQGDMGFVGRFLVQAPIHHRKHHILDISDEPVGNFALMPIWDRLFGTWRPVKTGDFAIGVDHPYKHGAWFIPDFLRDYRDFVFGMAGLIAKRFRALGARLTGRGLAEDYR